MSAARPVLPRSSRLLPTLPSSRSIKSHPTSRPPTGTTPLPMPPHKRLPPSSTSTTPSDPWSHLYDPTSPSSLTAHPIPARPLKHLLTPTPTSSPTTNPKISFSGAAKHGSTATQRERQVFSQIFDSLLIDQKPGAPPPRFTDLVRAEAKPGSRTNIDPDTGVVSFRPIPSLPPSLMGLAQNAAGRAGAAARVRREVRMPKEDPPELVELKREMAATASDLELLRWCDAVIFNPRLPTEKEIEEGVRRRGTGVGGEFYGQLVEEAMRLFGVVYKDHATVLALMEKVKARGAESYVVGATTRVYNRVIESVWMGWRDVGRVLEVVGEMRVNGIVGDEGTVEVLWGVVREASEGSWEEAERLKEEVTRIEKVLKGELGMEEM